MSNYDYYDEYLDQSVSEYCEEFYDQCEDGNYNIVDLTDNEYLNDKINYQETLSMTLTNQKLNYNYLRNFQNLKSISFKNCKNVPNFLSSHQNHLNNLQTVSIIDCGIQSLKCFKSNLNLVSLNLTNNQIQISELILLQGCVNLKQLFLKNNPLESNELLNEHLITTFQQNHQVKIDVFPDFSNQVSQLKIDISKNEVVIENGNSKIFISNAIYSLKFFDSVKLVKFQCENVIINFIQLNQLFLSQKQLQMIKLINNQLEITSFESLPKSCKSIEIQKNKVHLIQLNNDFEEIIVQNCEVLALEKIYALKIDFSHSDLSQIDLNKLKTNRLILKNCKITQFPEFSIGVPSYIDISNNQIKSLKQLSWDVRTLICQNNLIKSLKPIKNLPLTKLDLTGNKISSLRYVSTMKSLMTIDLSNNPLIDSSQLGFLQENLKLETIKFDHTPICDEDLFKQRKDQLLRFIKYRNSKQYRQQKRNNQPVAQLCEKELYVDFKIQVQSDKIQRKNQKLSSKHQKYQIENRVLKSVVMGQWLLLMNCQNWLELGSAE